MSSTDEDDLSLDIAISAFPYRRGLLCLPPPTKKPACRGPSAIRKSCYPPATDARGGSALVLQRGSAPVRSRSAVRDCSHPSAAPSAVAAPCPTLPPPPRALPTL